MLRAVVLICLVTAIAVPTSWARAVKAGDKEPKKCCVPEQFTILKESLIGTYIEGQGPLALSETQDTAFDYKNNRIGANITRTFFNGKSPENFRIVEDLTKKLLWVILADQKQCTKESITDFPFRCVPENATFGKTSYAADKKLFYDTWYFTVKDYLQTSGQYTLSVITQDNCIPFNDAFIGTSTAGGINQQIVSGSGYSRYQQGISDPERYFNLPEYCP